MPPASDLDAWAINRVEQALARLEETGDLETSSALIEQTFDGLVAFGPLDTPGALVRAGAIREHLRHMASLEGSLAESVGPFLRENPGLMTAITQLADDEYDEIPAVYTIVERLRRERGARVAEFPELVAAIAVTHDAGPPAQLVEQRVADPVGPLGVFDHLTANPGRLRLDPRELPGELLVFVVDAAVSADDLWWAKRRCGTDNNIGKRFHEIDYDMGGLTGVGGLRLNDDGNADFSLETLRRVGGVCRHQAFYAAHCGKAIGVPTVYVRADGPQLSHAWVGYLRVVGRRASWDMGEGRFGDYEKVRGEIRCPQTGRTLADQDVAMLADLFGSPLQERLRASVLFDAAERVAEAERSGGWPPDTPDGVDMSESGDRLGLPREAGPAVRFALLERGLRACPSHPRGWRILHGWAEDLDAEGRRFWFDALSELVGRRYPDVLMRAVRPMIRSIDDAAERDRAWLWAIREVRRQPQLVVELGVERARDLVEAGELDAAWELYCDVATRHANEGPFVITALDEAEALVGRVGRLDLMAPVYERVFRQMQRPRGVAPIYEYYSPYARVGRRYSHLLQELGEDAKAQRVLAELPSVRLGG